MTVSYTSVSAVHFSTGLDHDAGKLRVKLLLRFPSRPSSLPVSHHSKEGGSMVQSRCEQWALSASSLKRYRNVLFSWMGDKAVES